MRNCNDRQEPRPMRGRAGVLLCAGLLCAILGSCASRDARAPEVRLPASFSNSGTEAVPDRWWTALGDRQLDGLQERALGSNFTLESAWQRLQQAEAVVARERSALFPAVDALGSGEASSGDDFRNGEAGDGGQELGLGLAAAYEVDLWGRIRSQVEAERFRAQATFAEYQAGALTVSGEVASIWFQLKEARAQRALLDEQIEANAKVLRLLEVRLGEGQGRGVDVLRQRQLLEATREQQSVVEARIGVLANQLAVLLGDAPGAQAPPRGEALPHLPSLPRTGLPLELIQRRPDVQSAFFRVQAADQTLASAISAQYPRLNLTATLSTSGEKTSDLFNDWLRAIAGELIAPIIDAGQRAAEVERTRAALRELLADYAQAVLVAIREVEDSLIQEEKQIQRIEHLTEQVNLAQRSYQQLRNEYLNGVSNYIDVLTALTDEQQLRRDLLMARRILVEFRIALYRALAGGFETRRASRPGQTPARNSNHG